MGAMIDAAKKSHCTRCDGLGRLTANSVPCKQCGGSGEQPGYETVDQRGNPDPRRFVTGGAARLTVIEEGAE